MGLGKNTKAGYNPHEVTIGSTIQAWWICREHNHSWHTQVRNRTKGSNCPYCGNKKLLTGFNDLATVRPDLVQYWHPELNGDLTPRDVIASSHRKVHWLCPNGHHSYNSPSAKTTVKTKRFSCKECHRATQYKRLEN